MSVQASSQAVNKFFEALKTYVAAEASNRRNLESALNELRTQWSDDAGRHYQTLCGELKKKMAEVTQKVQVEHFPYLEQTIQKLRSIETTRIGRP